MSLTPIVYPSSHGPHLSSGGTGNHNVTHSRSYGGPLTTNSRHKNHSHSQLVRIQFSFSQDWVLEALLEFSVVPQTLQVPQVPQVLRGRFFEGSPETPPPKKCQKQDILTLNILFFTLFWGVRFPASLQNSASKGLRDWRNLECQWELRDSPDLRDLRDMRV